MPAIFETTMFRAHWGYSRIEQQKNKKPSDIGVIEPNVRAIEDELVSVMAQIEQGNWEIKSTLPLIASEYVTHSTINKQMDQSYAFGYGYGAAFTDGIIFLCQRKIELSEDEFAAREQTRVAQESTRKTERLKAFEAEFPITEKRKLLGGTIYTFKGKEYTNKAAAEADRNEILARMK
jgi:hypothetical protein